MRTVILTIPIILLLFVAGCVSNDQGSHGIVSTREDESMALRMSTPSFQHEGLIPEKYTCDGDDVSPRLDISGIPEGAESLALIVDDPDAPGGNWDHWLVWNIRPVQQTIKEGTVPESAVVGTNDFKRRQFGGPCPPSGTHRYFFKLYALDTMLDLPPGARKQDLEKAMRGHILDKSILIGRYARKRRMPF